jgi:hypothetical protein
MLFLPDDVKETLDSLLASLPAEDRGVEDFEAILAVDPNHFHSLCMLGGTYLSKNRDLAEEYFWRAARLYPCTWLPFKGLATVRGARDPNDPMAAGLTALDYFYVSQAPDLAKILLKAPEFKCLLPKTRIVPEFRRLSASSQVRAVSIALQASAMNHEPEEVADTLRGFRLIQSIFAREDLSTELIDEILARREEMAPLLIGVLRSWAHDIQDNDAATQNAIALLGEFGDASTVRAFVEILSADMNMTPAEWALDRIRDQDEAGFDREILKVAREASPTEAAPLLKYATYRYRRWPGAARLIDALVARIPQSFTPGKPTMLPVLVLTLITVRQREGIELSRKLLRENASRVPRVDRTDCDNLISELGAGPFPPLPENDHPEDTVYTICTGESLRENESESDLEDDSLDDYEPVQPVHREQRPGRNEPCWCGSGKKYKKCHLDADEHARVPPAQPAGTHGRSAIAQLEHDLVAFKDHELTRAERREAEETLYGPSDPEPDEIMLAEWTIYDWVSPKRERTFAEEYMRRNHSKLSHDQQDALQNWITSSYGLYEVMAVERGLGVTLKDMTSGESSFVHDKNTSNWVKAGDGIVARIVKGDRGNELCAGLLSVERRNIDPLLAWMEKDKRQFRMPWREYLKKRFPQIRRELYRLQLS